MDDDSDRTFAIHGAVSPAGDPDGPIDPLDDLAALRQEADREIAAERVWIPVPQRPGWALQFRCDYSDTDRRKHTRAARVKGAPRTAAGMGDMAETVDMSQLAALALGTYNTAIRRGVHTLEREDGKTLTVRDTEVSDLFTRKGETPSAAGTIRQLYVTDGDLIAAFNTYMSRTGFGTDATADDVDPTAG